MSKDLYHEQLLEEASDKTLVKELDDADLILNETNASCGDQITIYLEFTEKNNPLSSIKVASWQGSGCIISRAASNALIRKINSQHLTLANIKNINQKELEAMLGLESISLGRIKCLTLSWQALNKVTL